MSETGDRDVLLRLGAAELGALEAVRTGVGALAKRTVDPESALVAALELALVRLSEDYDLAEADAETVPARARGVAERLVTRQRVPVRRAMNDNHRQLCASDEWGEYIRDELLPWVLGDRPLGDDVLEIGPGPGLTTGLLRARLDGLTTIEADPQAAEDLARRMAGANVVVVHADATDMPFPAARFSAAIAMTMLHHVPSAAAQDHLLAEVRRVLRPGGWLLGEDSLDDPGFREFHSDDVCVPVDPGTFEARLRAAGFAEAEVERGDGVFRFAAKRA